jgi:hypothetical protein
MTHIGGNCCLAAKMALLGTLMWQNECWSKQGIAMDDWHGAIWGVVVGFARADNGVKGRNQARRGQYLGCVSSSCFALQICPAQAITIEAEEREDGSRRTTRCADQEHTRNTIMK